MAKTGSNKPAVLQAHVLEMAAQGISGRRIARYLHISRGAVARILAGPEARAIAFEARERARQMVAKADEALHKSLDRGSAPTAIAVLRGAGVFETRAETIVRHHIRDKQRAQDSLAALERQSRLDAERKFGRTPQDEESGRLDRLAFIERESAASRQSEESPAEDVYLSTVRGRLRHRPRR